MVIDLVQAGLRTALRAMGTEEVTLETDRAKLHGFAAGRGGGQRAPLVFLHGLGDASTTWVRSILALREHHDLLALDLPPFGLSKLTDGSAFLTPRQQAQEVVQVLAERVEGPAVLVGQSMGGWVAQWVLHQAPELVERAVLISPAGSPVPGSQRAIELLQPATNDEVLELWEAMWYRPPTVAKAAAGTVLKRFTRPELAGFLEAVGPEDLVGPRVLSGIEVPALVIWGAHDGLLDPGVPSFLAYHWGARLERTWLARCAHLPHVERPRATVRRLRAFLGEGRAGRR